MNDEARSRLELYLADHIAAGVGGLALCKRTARAERTSEFGPPLRTLVGEIERDLGQLRELAARLGARERAPFKERMARLAEKLGRLKLNGSVLSRSRLSRVYDLEMLWAAVRGKRCLWYTLLELASSDAQLNRLELQNLLTRADAQEEEIRDLHARAARRAFGVVAEDVAYAPA